MRFFALNIFFLLFSSTIYADISTLRAYPASIKASFIVPEKIKVPEETDYKKKRRKRGKKEELVAPAMIQHNRFIRIVNTLSLEKKQYTAILFYDENNTLIEKKIVLDTDKPSPEYISFMDKTSYNNFKGKLDVYDIPEEAEYFIFAVIDEEDNIIATANHENFNNNNQVQIVNFQKIRPADRAILQVELLGTKENLFTRVGIFHIL